MGNLGDVFEKRLLQMGIKTKVDAAMICEAFDASVLEVFGENGAKNAKAVSYKNSTLKVAVTSSAWANEISLRQMELKDGERIRFIFEQGMVSS